VFALERIDPCDDRGAGSQERISPSRPQVGYLPLVGGPDPATGRPSASQLNLDSPWNARKLVSYGGSFSFWRSASNSSR